MGQKVKPISIRIGRGLPASFSSVFFTSWKQYPGWLLDDYKIRAKIKSDWARAQISKVFIQRISDKALKVTITASKLKIIIGENGSNIEKIKTQLMKEFNLNDVSVSVDGIHKPALEAPIVAYNIAKQIESYAPFRMTMKKAVEETMKQNAKGIKVSCSGRLGGAEIAKTEWQKVGRVPLHTLRADIDYYQHNAKTKYGIIGVKVWVYRSDSSSPKKRISKITSL
jgi:small subunit ribosomal protein S3